jgi:hypothetical protein
VSKKLNRNPSVFDRFAAHASDIASGALFFIFCAALVASGCRRTSSCAA